jgi:phosphohistidine phosphatase
MRHGPAEDRAPSGRDFDRVLTRAGREVVERSARALRDARDAAGTPVRLLSSPFRRAFETAHLVASAFVTPLEVQEHDDLAADAGLPLALVASLTAAGTDAILVGHQPTVEELARELLRPASPDLRGGFRTALVLTLEHRDGSWRAAGIFDPHEG